MRYRHLTFNPTIASQKPTNKDACPFCEQTQLGRILDKRGDMIWVENKFPTLEDTYQTLVIESSQHDGDISTYDVATNRELFAFLFEKWAELEACEDFQTVALYRNFGPISGGSLRHPHSQIVGFKHLNAYETLNLSSFDGLLVRAASDEQAEVRIATQPLLDFTEFNVKITDEAYLSQLADAVQRLCNYVLNGFLGGACSSYNLFFYHMDTDIYCKVVPRFVTSAYMIGYGIHQVNQRHRLEEIARDLRDWLK